MNSPSNTRRFWIQVGICTSLSLAFSMPSFLTRVPNTVVLTYQLAAFRIWNSISPYLPPLKNSDWFRYSPSFALIFKIFDAFAYGWPLLLAWSFLNILVFWIGMARWVSVGSDGWHCWLLLFLAGMSLHEHTFWQQTNALIVGLILIGVADFRDGRFLRSSGYLSLAGNLKCFGLPFLFGLLTRRTPRFWCGALFVSLELLILPSMFIGWQRNWEFHLEWFRLLAHDTSGAIMDLESALRSEGFGSDVSHIVRLIVGGVTFGLLCAPRNSFFPTASRRWLSLGLTGLVLFNPRTELPTFVMVSPALVMLWMETRWFRGLEKYCMQLILLVCFLHLAVLIKYFGLPTLDFTRTFCVFALWLLSFYIGIRRAFPFRSRTCDGGMLGTTTQ